MDSHPDSLVTRDPVCGMTVDPAQAAAKADHSGQTYYFCCNRCAEKFRADPETYLRAASPEPMHAASPSGGFVQLGGIKPASKSGLVTFASVTEGTANSETHPQSHSPDAKPQPSAPPKTVRRHLHLPDGPRSSPGLIRALVPNVEWRSSRKFPRPPQRAPNTPARCIPKSFAPSQALARSAAWRLSRERHLSKKKQIPNSSP